jgi:protein-L-isoaspartate(D-aspartate) O-methyltransferase
VQLSRRGISNPRVLDAFREVAREEFVTPQMREFAHADSPLPIGHGQTISQPYIVAVTLEALELEGSERVLEVGTGSGYAAALLGRLAQRVFTIERHAALAEEARERLARLGFDNVEVRHGDGTLGWPEHAPYDAIAVAASGPEVPKTLLRQLAIGGRLVIPVGSDESSQSLVRITRKGPEDFQEETLTQVRFVPLIGAEGWSEPQRVRTPSASPTKSEASVPALVRESGRCSSGSATRGSCSSAKPPTARASSIECVPGSRKS